MKKITRRLAKTGAALVIAVPAMLVSTSASAAPAATGSATATASATASPQIDADCQYVAIGPTQPTYHGSAYGQAAIVSCVGAPAACHLTVDLQKLEPQGYYVNVAHADRGWAPCSGKVLTTGAYKCPGGYSTSSYTSLATLAVEAIDGTPGPTDAVYSATEKLACS